MCGTPTRGCRQGAPAHVACPPFPLSIVQGRALLPEWRLGALNSTHFSTARSQALAAAGELDASDKIQVLPGGAMTAIDGKDGFVFSSPKLLTNIKAACAVWANGQPPASVDGTFKVHRGNYVLIILGSSTLRLDARSHRVVTSFRPWSFGLFPSESAVRPGLLLLCARGTRQRRSLQQRCSRGRRGFCPRHADNCAAHSPGGDLEAHPMHDGRRAAPLPEHLEPERLRDVLRPLVAGFQRHQCDLPRGQAHHLLAPCRQGGALRVGSAGIAVPVHHILSFWKSKTTPSVGESVVIFAAINGTRRRFYA